MRVLPLFLAVFVALPALAAPPTLSLPNGARWAVFAPKAERFAKEAGALLETAAKSDPPLSPRILNNDFVRSTGLGLLSTDELQARGVDTARGWTFFERQGSTYLEVSLKDKAKLVAALEAWGAGRLLKAREEKATAHGLVVTFARAKGTRPAAGYVLGSDRAGSLLRSYERTPSLENAFVAVENAAPVRPSADGTLIAWFDAAPFAKEAWLGLQASEKGLEIAGSARDVDPGWAVAEASKKPWALPLLAPAKAEEAVRLRFTAGEKAATQLARLFTQASGPADQAVADAVAQVAKGPLEVHVERLVPPKGASGGLSAQAIVNVLSPALVLPERADNAKKVADAAKGSTGEFHVATSGKALIVGLGDEAPLEVPAEPSGTPAVTCGSAKPLAALKIDGTAIDRSLEGIGLFGAMRDDLLLGLYALHSELGLLLRRLEPMTMAACQDGGKTTILGRVRFREK